MVRDAATVILVSDRPDLHVLMLERTRRAVFGPARPCSPAARSMPRIASRALAQRVVDLDDAAASAEQGIARRWARLPDRRGARVLRGGGHPARARRDSGRPVEHDAELAAAARCGSTAGTLTFVDLLETRGLVLDARELRLFSHWLTPIGAPRRYNTWFFVAPAPDGEDGTHDDNELVASAWVRPVDALAQHAAGDIDLIFPTEMSLRALARYDARARRSSPISTPRRATRAAACASSAEGNRRARRAPGRCRCDRRGAWTIPLPDISYPRRARRRAREVGE